MHGKWVFKEVRVLACTDFNLKNFHELYTPPKFIENFIDVDL